MIFFCYAGFKVKDVKNIQFHTVTITRDLIRQGHVTLNMTSLIFSSSEAGSMVFLVSLVTPMKNHRSGFPGTSDENSHAQFHVTLIYKVTLNSYSVELYLFETLDPENLPNKKRIIALASLEPELGKVTLRVTWFWHTRSRVIVTVVTVWSYNFFLHPRSQKPAKQKKDHRSRVTRTRVGKDHAQGHVILSYKVTLDSYSVDLYLFDIRDPKNLRNKKRSSL